VTKTERLRQLEHRLWQTAVQWRAISKLGAADYSIPVLGLIFLRYADVRFGWAEERLAETATVRSPVTKAHYQAEGVTYVPETARFGYLKALPESADLGRAVNDAMAAIEDHNPDLTGVLPRDYASLEKSVLVELLRLIGSIPDDIDGDAFGKIYEYFLGNFTPTSIAKLIVDIIEPFSGRVYDPACGSGGMFVQSARFVDRHKGDGSTALSIYGQERVDETVRLCKMNLAVHGLSGDIRSVNTYYEDPHRSVGRFDFVMANPPFNVNGVDKERIKDDPRFGLGIPSVDNANYLWIQVFSSALNDTGRAGFVMASSASDAQDSEMAVRRKLIDDRQVDIVVAVGSTFFYTVTLPVTLWFLDKGKRDTDRADKVLFIDARGVFPSIDQRQRAFNPEQHEFLANIVRMYRGQKVEFANGSELYTRASFPDLTYVDVPGLCKVASIEEMADQDWSLNPARYVLPFAGEFVPLCQLARRIRSNVQPGDLIREQGVWTEASRSQPTVIFALRVQDANVAGAMLEWLNSRFGMDGPGTAGPTPSEFVPRLVMDPSFQKAIGQVGSTRARLRALVQRHDGNAFDFSASNAAEWASREASRASQVEALLAVFHDPSARAEALFPYPVAALVRAGRVSSEPFATRAALLKLGEALVRAYGAVAAACASQDVLSILGPGPVAAGRWMEVIRKSAASTSVSFPNGFDWAEGQYKVGWHLGRLIKLRNDAHHTPSIESQPEIIAMIAEARLHIEQVLEQSEWMAWCQWVAVDRCEYTEGGYVVRGRALRGSDPQWLEISIPTLDPVVPRSVVAVDDRDSMTVDLSHLARVAACETCMRDEFYSLDEVGTDLTYLSMKGHKFTMPTQ